MFSPLDFLLQQQHPLRGEKGKRELTCGLSRGTPNRGLFGTYPDSGSIGVVLSTLPHDMYMAPPSTVGSVAVANGDGGGGGGGGDGWWDVGCFYNG